MHGRESLFLSVRLKNVFNAFSEDAGDPEREGKHRIVFVVLNGVHGLPRDIKPAGKFFLRETVGFAELPDAILH